MGESDRDESQLRLKRGSGEGECPAARLREAHPPRAAHFGEHKDKRGAGQAGQQLWRQQQGDPRWDTESRFQIESSRVLIIAGIPSSWLPGSGPSIPPVSRQWPQQQQSCSQHQRGREHSEWDESCLRAGTGVPRILWDLQTRSSDMELFPAPARCFRGCLGAPSATSPTTPVDGENLSSETRGREGIRTLGRRFGRGRGCRGVSHSFLRSLYHAWV